MSKYTTIPMGQELVKVLDSSGTKGYYTLGVAINLLDRELWLTPQREGLRVFNPKPIYETGHDGDPAYLLFSKAWYEVAEIIPSTTPKTYTWKKVEESGGGSVEIDEATIIKDSATEQLKVNIDKESLVYDSVKSEVKVNIDEETIIKDTTNNDKLKVKTDGTTIKKGSNGLEITGTIPAKDSAGDDTSIEFGQTSDGKWGYKPIGADSVIPFKIGTIIVGSDSEVFSWRGTSKNVTGDIIILMPFANETGGTPNYTIVNNTGEDIYRYYDSMSEFKSVKIEKDATYTFTSSMGCLFACEDASKKVNINIKDNVSTINRILLGLNLSVE